MIKRIDTGTITATDTTATGSIGYIKGIIKKIEIVASASTDFHLWIDASDKDNGNIVDEEVLGTNASKITVNTTLVIYPVTPQYLTTNVITDPDQYSELIVCGNLEYDIAAIAVADTFRIVAYYEPFN